MEEALGVKKIIMVEKQKDRFDLRSLLIKNNYLKSLFEETSFFTFEVDLIIFQRYIMGPNRIRNGHPNWRQKISLKSPAVRKTLIANLEKKCKT